jgi:C1A family cysteine protease
MIKSVEGVRPLWVLALALVVQLAAIAVPSEKQNELNYYAEQGKRLGWTFETGDTPAMNGSLEEMTGLVVPPDWEKKAIFINPKPANSPLPAHFDWREQAGGLTPVKMQGQCGSCWAFGTVGVLESAIKIRDGETKVLSEQQLVSCNRNRWGCGGGYFAHDLHLHPGAASNADFPYVARHTRCVNNIPHEQKIEKWGYVGKAGRAPTVEEIKQAIYEYGPVATTVHVGGPFMSYRGGIFNYCSKWGGGNHIVNIVGWDDAEGVWILRNSWSEKWGEKGYMRIRYGCNRIGDQTTFAIYKPKCTPQPQAEAGEDRAIEAGEATRLGGAAVEGHAYQWSPETGLDNPTAAQPIAKPAEDTVYTLKVTTACGTAEKSVRVTVTQSR